MVRRAGVHNPVGCRLACTGSQSSGNQCTAMGGMGTITILVFHRGQSAVDCNVKLCEDGSSQLLREDMSELDKLMDTAIQPSKPPKKSVRFCSEVMEHHIDEGPPASPGVSQPLRLGSGSVPALPVMQPTPHVSHASEFEPVVVPDVNVVDTSGEHSGALPEHPDQVQPEVTDTHPVNVQAEQEQRYPQRTRRPPGEWWNATANRDSDQEPTSEDGTALLTSDRDSATPLNYMEVIRSSEADEWRRACDDELATFPSCNTRSGR
jgi:hypothetical protein